MYIYIFIYIYKCLSQRQQKISLLVQAAIRKELNEFKSCEMEVHEDSKQFTR